MRDRFVSLFKANAVVVKQRRATLPNRTDGCQRPPSGQIAGPSKKPGTGVPQLLVHCGATQLQSQAGGSLGPFFTLWFSNFLGVLTHLPFLGSGGH